MADLRQLPALANITRAPGDDFTLQVTVTNTDGPVDLTGWTFDTRAVDATIVDAAAGRFDIVPRWSTVGVRRWWVTRSSPSARRLLSGSDEVSEQADRTPGDVDLSLQLVDGDAVVLSITGGGSGSGGVTAHGDLTGLDADDHPQYLRVDSGAYQPPGNYVESTDVTDIVELTQSAYDALTPDADTLYIIVGA